MNKATVEFYAVVHEERNPLLDGFGKISSPHLMDFVGKRVLIRVVEQDDAPENP